MSILFQIYLKMIKSYRSKRRKIQEEIELMDNGMVGLTSKNTDDNLSEHQETSVVLNFEPSNNIPENNLITDLIDDNNESFNHATFPLSPPLGI